MSLRMTVLVVFIASTLAGIGCGKGDSSAEPGPVAQPGPAKIGAAALAKQIYMTRCVTCHGPRGEGDGPASANLNPKPRNYTDKAWQASITDEKLAETIVKGGMAVKLSALMPANPDLQDKPEVVAELIKRIRSFAQ